MKMAQSLTVTELSGNLTAILERVGQGERYVIEREGNRLAVLGPIRPEAGVTGRELSERLGDLTMPGDGFADDLEAIQASQSETTMPAWPA